MTEATLRAAGLVKCDACSRWTYRNESVPCPFCPDADTCITCGGVADTDDPTTHGFIAADGVMTLMCGGCAATVASVVWERENGR